MDIYFRLLGYALLPVGVSAVFYLLTENKNSDFMKLPYWGRQLVIGLSFGLAAAIATDFGVDVGGATANARDAAPLCAGLLFGSPAGIIAGTVGGVHRWVMAYYGAGMYSQAACSVSTFLAGFYAAFLRKFVLEDRRVGWSLGALAAVVMEVIHLTILFLSHLDNLTQAYAIVKIVTVPMILANAVSVGCAAGFLTLINTAAHSGKRKKKTMTEAIHHGLLFAVVLAYLSTTTFVYMLQTSTALLDAKNLLSANLEDVQSDIGQVSATSILRTLEKIADRFEALDYDVSKVKTLAAIYDVTEINVVDENGIITGSTEPEYIGYDIRSMGQEDVFLSLTDGTDFMVQDFQNSSYAPSDTARARKYAELALSCGGFLQIGYDYDSYRESLLDKIGSVAQNRRIGQQGYLIIAYSDGTVVCDHEGKGNYPLSDTGLDLTGRRAGEIFPATVNGVKARCSYADPEGYLLIGMIPEEEVFFSRDISIYVNSFMQVLSFAVLFYLIFFLVRAFVVNEIRQVNATLGRISEGRLEERICQDGTEEMSQLSGYINRTLDALKGLITEAETRMEKDLALAREIQHSSMPAVFPPYPEIRAFDIYAEMKTAREVGGDFYDFFLLGENRLAFLVADVSGKGIPAAMFMMRAKTLIKSTAEAGLSAEEVIFQVNNRLCSDNDAGMFVTVWFGILDYSTGHVIFVNAGHNPPVLLPENGDCALLKTRPGLVLAGMEGVPYRKQELDLLPGDRLFLYTDGVTEATCIRKELYGEDRLLSWLTAHKTEPISRIPGGILEDIDVFIDGAEQFDDITMLVLEYRGAGEKNRNG